MRQLALEVGALQQVTYLNKLYHSQQRALVTAEDELQALYARLTVLIETWLASRSYLEDVRASFWGNPQVHTRHSTCPSRQSWLAEIWAAVTRGELLLALLVLVILHPVRWPLWFLLVGFTFAFIEEAMRGRLVHFLLNATILPGVVTILVLDWEVWWLLLVGGRVVMVLLSVIANLRELSGK